jgi:thioester reductase-like protein
MIFNCAQMGAAPEMDYWVDQTPVDFVSGAVWLLSQRPDSSENLYHLTNPRPMLFRQIVEWFAAHGKPLQWVPYGEWLKRLQKHLEDQGRPEEYYALAPVWSDGRPAKNLVYDIRNVTAGLAGTGLECPPVDERLLERYFGELL